MPLEPLHPPYGPGSLQPRRLNRWLDVNSQNGPLTRTVKFITIPQIPPIAHNWHGVSDIVAVIYYCSPNNFSFKAIPYCYKKQLNFLLTVASRDVDGNVYRYRINDIWPSSFFLEAPLYNGQLIGRNMRFEVWSIDNTTPFTSTKSPPFHTSMQGDYDYRFGDDDALVEYTMTLSSNFRLPLPTTFDIMWPIYSTFDCGCYSTSQPFPPPSGGGGGGGGGNVVKQVYEYTGSAPTLLPDDVSIPNVAYHHDGNGPTFYWNTTTHVWE